MNIKKFYERVGLAANTEAEISYEFLKKLQQAALYTIPYENIDLVEGKIAVLDADEVFEKVVIRGRGGYCFELNCMFEKILSQLGFVTERYLARFWKGECGVPIRRHRLTGVYLDGERYIVDIGIGAVAPRIPLLLKEGIVQEYFGESYRFEREADFGWVLYELYHGEWKRYYSFTEEKQFDDDFISPAFYCDRHPDSKFNKSYIIAMKTPNGRKTLSGNCYKEFVGSEIVRIEENMSDERVEAVLWEEFGIKEYK